MACCGTGPGFATPRDAFRYATREKLVYIPCIVPSKDRPDYLATVDIDPESPTFCKAWSNFIIENLRSSLLMNTSETYAEILWPRLYCKCNKIQLLYRLSVDCIASTLVMRSIIPDGTLAQAVMTNPPCPGVGWLFLVWWAAEFTSSTSPPTQGIPESTRCGSDFSTFCASN